MLDLKLDNTATLFHFNINETRSSEIKEESNQKENSRLTKLCQKIAAFTDFKFPDFICLSELQYDLPHVPTKAFQTTGKNFLSLLMLLQKHYPSETLQEQSSSELSELFMKTIFHSGHCGMEGRAHPQENSEYVDDREAPGNIRLRYGDLENCSATLPGQYGIGFYTRHTITDVSIISKLECRQFKPGFTPSNYLLPKRPQEGEAYPVPDTLPLFDKAFMKIGVKVNEKTITILFTHNMPASNFGTEKGINIERNRLQLEFLEWVLTGSTSFTPPSSLKDDEDKLITPLNPNEPVIVVGDLNVDIRREEPGAGSLRSIRSKQYHFYPNGRDTQKDELQLDYIISKNIQVLTEKIGNLEEELSDHVPLMSTFGF